MSSNDAGAQRGGPSRRAELKQAYKENPPPMELQVLEALWLERLRPYGEAGYNAPPA